MNTVPSLFGAPPYPIASLPPTVKSAFDEVKSKVQAPDALIAMSFLAVMSAASQRQIDVKLPSGQVKPVSLNLVAIAASGERKTSVDNIVAEPLYSYDEASSQLHSTALMQYQAKLASWGAMSTGLRRRLAKAAQSGEATDEVEALLERHEHGRPLAPRLDRIVHQDVTYGGLMKVLHGTGRSIAIMSDEGDIILKGAALSRLGTLNKLWDGASMLTSERVRSESFTARDPRVTMSLMVQPAILEKYMNGKGAQARESGLFARCLMAYPASTQGWRFNNGAEFDWEHLPIFHERVNELLRQRQLHNEDEARIVVEFDDSAKQKWLDIVNKIEFSLQPWREFNDSRDFVSKAGEQIGRLAALFHHFTGATGNISCGTLQQAASIVEWHAWEFKRIFSDQIKEPEDQVNANKVEHYLRTHYWMRNHQVAEKTAVLKAGPVRTAAAFDVALTNLIYRGAITIGQRDPAIKTKFIFLVPAYFVAKPMIGGVI